MKRISLFIISLIILVTLPSMKGYQEEVTRNDISELLQKVIKEHNLSTIKTTERRGEGYVVKRHVLFSFEENNMLKVDQGGYNLNHMYRYDIVLEPERNRDSPYLEIYF